jgi:PAS domain S-box-containing protein
MTANVETPAAQPGAEPAAPQRSASPHQTLDIFDLAAVGMGIVDPSGYWLRANPVLSSYFGYGEEEFLRTLIGDLIHPEDLPAIEEGFERLRRGAIERFELELRCIHKNGAEFWVQAHNAALRMPGRDKLYVLTQIQDITELKASEDRLRRRDEIYRMIVRNLPAAAVAFFDRDLRYRTVEGSGFELLGMTPDMLEGKTIWEAWSAERCEEFEPRHRAALDGSPTIFETTIGHHRFEVRIVPVPDDEGAIVGGILAAQDITDRLQAELAVRATAEALARSNRELEEFAFVASHDLRAPLVSLRGMATILAEEYADRLDDEGRFIVERVQVNANNMQQLLDELLDIARVGRTESAFGAVDLALIAERVIEEQRFALTSRNGAVECDLDGVVVEANWTRMVQLFTNLIDNAIKYTPPERAPHIVIWAEDDNQQWVISIADNGVGIPVDHCETIFGIFQRLRSGKDLNPAGSGMGLALVARIIALHGGLIWIEPGAREGSTFHFTLPKAGFLERGELE